MENLIDEAFGGTSRFPEIWNIARNPFHKDPPIEELIDKVFVGRKQEMRRTISAMLDLPRNVMVRGGYGMGKTTFVKKLLREFENSKTRRFLVAYEALVGDRPLDFQHAVLKALSKSLRHQVTEAENIYSNLLRNHEYDHPDLHIQALIEKANLSQGALGDSYAFNFRF